MSVIGRIARAGSLQGAVFEEVEHDASALPQAALVVVLAGIARGIGVFPEEGAIGIVAGVVGGLLFWAAAAATLDGIGVGLLGGTSSYRELLRTLGFAAAPLLLLIFQALPWPPLRTGVWIAAHALATLALTLAVHHALDLSPARSLLACVAAIGVGLLLVVGAGALLFGWLVP